MNLVSFKPYVIKLEFKTGVGMKNLVVAGICLVVITACNQEQNKHLRAQDLHIQQGSCSEVDQYADVGSSCVTSKGIKFQRVQDGWQDTASSLVWYDFNPGGASRYKASQFCKARGLMLPTGYSTDYNGKEHFPGKDSDFVVAENNGLREVLKDIKGLYLWSSSQIYPVTMEGAYYFEGDTGKLYYGGASVIPNDFPFSARCVTPHDQPESSEPRGFSEILRDQNGQIIYAYQDTAMKMCAERGQHLPTAREMAKLSVSRGSKGILEAAPGESSDYKMIHSQNPNGQIDNFYFSFQGYKRPLNEMEMHCAWTSSKNGDFKVVFYPSSGGLDDQAMYGQYWYIACAVRCAK
jgi:hypothetical protein